MGQILGHLAGQPQPPQEPAAVGEFSLGLEQLGHRCSLPLLLRRKLRQHKLGRILDFQVKRESAATVARAVAKAEAGGLTALHIAAAVGWLELVVKLIETKSCALNAASAEGITALHIAAFCGRADVLRALLDGGADLLAASQRGSTALHFVATDPSNNSPLCALLAHPSCTPEFVNQLGYRSRSALLMVLLAHGNVAMVRSLLTAGANPSEKTAAMSNVSLLHNCAHLTRVDAMRALIEAGAQVDCAANDGITVLQECFVGAPNTLRCEASKRTMFRLLVDAGANVNATVPVKRYTVLHFAMASCRDEATALLIADSGINLSIAVNKPVLLGDASAKHSLLHLASMRGWSRMAERLVAAGADLLQRNKDGMQPLHVAVLNENAETVAVLLRLGADPLGTCPDCYPSYASWKRRRGIQAMQALMQGDNGPGMLPALMQLFNAGQLAEDTPRISAVDLACCVARHIPTVEAFVELGVRPSETALQLAEHAVPIMRAVVERPMLTHALHQQMPLRFRKATQELLRCLSRPTRTTDRRAVSLSPDAVAAVLQRAAFPVSGWATPSWLIAQAVRPPLPREASSATQPNAGAGVAHGQAAAGAAAAAGGAAGPPGGDEVPAFVQAMMEQMQQQLGVAMDQPQFVIMHHGPEGPPGQGQAPGQGPGAAMFPGMPDGLLPGPPPGWLAGLPPGAAAAMGGAGGGAGAGGGGPGGGGPGGGDPGGPGLQMLQHHHVNQGDQQFHVMQFAIDLPLGMPPPGLLAGGLPGGPGLGPMPVPGGQAGGMGGGPPPGFAEFLQQLMGGIAADVPGLFLEEEEEEDEEDEVDEEEADAWEDEEGQSDWEDEHMGARQAAIAHAPVYPGPPQPAAAGAAAAVAGPPAEAPLAQPPAPPAPDGAGPSRQPAPAAGQEQPAGSGRRPDSCSERYELRSRKRQRRE
ncbi:hypothetical protein D9Q98_001406 [Chlorella vulgaris]|uniref:Uncharacterized protein n=1 Tax=Chlorella vulgaris TaxID=3077 RepID=A0A9D4TZZ3_CHLVU|nr:hypothetical protein D9Q98_001406 [Chlorella vulgaris]